MLWRREASSWAGACSAEEGGGRFTGRPADWLRVATSGGVRSILLGAAGRGACAAGGRWHLASLRQLRVQPQVSGAHDVTSLFTAGSQCDPPHRQPCHLCTQDPSLISISTSASPPRLLPSLAALPTPSPSPDGTLAQPLPSTGPALPLPGPAGTPSPGRRLAATLSCEPLACAPAPQPAGCSSLAVWEGGRRPLLLETASQLGGQQVCVQPRSLAPCCWTAALCTCGAGPLSMSPLPLRGQVLWKLREGTGQFKQLSFPRSLELAPAHLPRSGRLCCSRPCCSPSCMLLNPPPPIHPTPSPRPGNP
ncbi:PREDICTED: uncharacterized protein LOC106146611 [Chinchilla lanigera]|uniref:uncharacterized protein LOC106146611 n=1 Tax=Chinchilla lanigera TaxID=34839 RepID=UPI0006986613|nr:PREDICTED: uncharacterized protein LOC106146611 [Chinchilla lanigera]